MTRTPGEKPGRLGGLLMFALVAGCGAATSVPSTVFVARAGRAELQECADSAQVESCQREAAERLLYRNRKLGACFGYDYRAYGVVGATSWSGAELFEDPIACVEAARSSADETDRRILFAHACQSGVDEACPCLFSEAEGAPYCQFDSALRAGQELSSVQIAAELAREYVDVLSKCRKSSCLCASTGDIGECWNAAVHAKTYRGAYEMLHAGCPTDSVDRWGYCYSPEDLEEEIVRLKLPLSASLEMVSCDGQTVFETEEQMRRRTRCSLFRETFHVRTTEADEREAKLRAAETGRQQHIRAERQRMDDNRAAFERESEERRSQAIATGLSESAEHFSSEMNDFAEKARPGAGPSDASSTAGSNAEDGAPTTDSSGGGSPPVIAFEEARFLGECRFCQDFTDCVETSSSRVETARGRCNEGEKLNVLTLTNRCSFAIWAEMISAHAHPLGEQELSSNGDKLEPGEHVDLRICDRLIQGPIRYIAGRFDTAPEGCWSQEDMYNGLMGGHCSQSIPR